MVSSTAALTHKSLLLCRAVISRRPLSHFCHQSHSPAIPIKTSAIRSCSRHSHYYPLNSSHGVVFKGFGRSGVGFSRLGSDNFRVSAVADDGSGGYGGSGSRNSGGGGESSGGDGTGGGGEKWSLLSCIVKKLESINTFASSVWWVIGFYWIVVGGQALLQDCPLLYWLTVVFLAFGVFFIIFCVGMACVIFFALFCFIPIIALADAKRIREGASEKDIRLLPKYRFGLSNTLVMVDNNKEELVKARIDACNGNHVSELSLHPDDSECCICLSPYVDGAELYRLPCTHHFHCGCISRWLRTKATCPLCKFNILRRDSLV